jgi:predicted ATPase
MIDYFRVRQYKALKDVTLKLTPVHLLIGPNDSGKTSILEAVAALCRSIDQPISAAFVGRWQGRNLVWHAASQPVVELIASGIAGESRWEYYLSGEFNNLRKGIQVASESATIDGVSQPFSSGRSPETSAVSRLAANRNEHEDGSDVAPIVHEQLSGVQYYHWIPRLLSLPVAPDSKRRFRMESSGFGLASLLDDILGYDREAFGRLEKELQDLFPQIRSIKLISEPAFKTGVDDPEQIPVLQRADGKGIHLQYADGHVVPAAQVSDGVLLVLAYLAILHSPDPPRLLLVEEPENGIHPKRLQDVLGMLRKLTERHHRTQVILTTHSPYVVDLFKPEEVTLCWMQEDGSVSVRQLSESELVRDELDVFTLGEIWTAEGDAALAGVAEARTGEAR